MCAQRGLACCRKRLAPPHRRPVYFSGLFVAIRPSPRKTNEQRYTSSSVLPREQNAVAAAAAALLLCCCRRCCCCCCCYCCCLLLPPLLLPPPPPPPPLLLLLLWLHRCSYSGIGYRVGADNRNGKLGACRVVSERPPKT